MLLVAMLLIGCVNTPFAAEPHSHSTTAATVTSLSTEELLQQSWQAYRDWFIQEDGRVIDRESNDRTTSEGQAYALLRAVLSDDPGTFDRVLQWSENNLQRRKSDGTRQDQLWGWEWGRDEQNNWTILDTNFASDADLDAITALILASRRWDESKYLELATLKLKDLWELGTVQIRNSASEDARYFLPGPKQVFQPEPDQIQLNPSYFAPYAFRLFAQVDSAHDWLSLVESSYSALNESAQLSAIGLPSNWVVLDTARGEFQPLSATSPLQSIYSFDAYRVWWRIALDADWFDEPRAKQYLQQHLQPLATLWRSNQRIPAQIDLQGKPLVDYESTAQYAMLHAAFRITNPQIADQLRQQKILTTYQNGFWDNDSAYYTQNLSWFGLFPSAEITVSWIKP